jgi:hypothetical protein
VDAVHAYGDVSQFRETAVLRDDGWHVDCELVDTHVNGDGSHYIVDAASDMIESKRNEH